MSKFVKDAITSDLKSRWEGVDDALLVEVSSLEANKTVELRKQLREKSIKMLVVKNSIARRATEGTALGNAFDGAGGSTAVVWGAEDIVSLAKEVTKFSDSDDFGEFTTKGGVMDGARLSPEEVKQVSKWPSRTEQLSILMGQVLGPASTLSGQLLACGANLASQVKQKSEGEE